MLSASSQYRQPACITYRKPSVVHLAGTDFLKGFFAKSLVAADDSISSALPFVRASILIAERKGGQRP
jgi:hypothetical protein